MTNNCDETLFVEILEFLCGAMSESNKMHKIVDSKNGKIRGIRQTTLFEKMDFYAFKGMTYGLAKL